MTGHPSTLPTARTEPTVAALEAWTVPYTEPNDHGSMRYLSLVRVQDTEGHVGWGEAVTIALPAAQATTAILRAWAEPLLGAPATPNALVRAVERQGWWYSTHGGVSGFAAAALDIAAWDLLGRRAGLPLAELLGGAVHESLPAIVTSHAMIGDLRRQAETFAQWREDLDALGVKVGFGKAGDARLGYEHDRDVAFMKELRGALGPDAQIMIDISPLLSWSHAEAIARVRAFEEHGLQWIEEPLGADDPQGYARLRAATSTLLAYGEREWTTAGMVRLLDTGTLDVLGIDPGRAGGITGFIGGARAAAERHRQVNAHAFAGPISYAAGLACSLVSPNCRQFEVAPLRNSLIADLAPELPRPVAGRVAGLSGPGLGVDLSRDAVAAIALP